MEQALAAVIGWFGLTRNGLLTVFLWSMASATLLPVGSEPIVFGYVKLNPDQFWWAIVVATLGNTAGGMINYVMGYGARQALARDREERYLRVLKRWGPKVLFLSFLPVAGDPLCAAAGWVRLPFWPVLLWMLAGKLVRYVVMTGILMWVPDAFWQDAWATIQAWTGMAMPAAGVPGSPPQ